jgi:hypothetical protein
VRNFGNNTILILIIIMKLWNNNNNSNKNKKVISIKNRFLNNYGIMMVNNNNFSYTFHIHFS